MKSQKKRKRSSLEPEALTREEREDRIRCLKKEMDGLFELYRDVMDRKLDVNASDLGAVNSAIAVLLEESKLPLSKLVEEIYDKVKETSNGCGVTPATVKATVVSVGQRVMYGVPNLEADILEDDSHSCLWCWETRDVKLMPGSVRGAIKIRRICRKKIQERITAIYELMAILQKDESSQNYKSNLLKVSEKLGKLLNEADIRTFVNSMMQKNGANLAEKEAKQEEKLLIKQLDKKMRAAEKEKKRLDSELHKEKWQSEREQKQSQEEEERRREKEESEMRKQLRKQEEAEKDQRRLKREEAEQKKKLAIQKQASIMEKFIRRNKNDSSHQNNLSLTKTITSDSLVQKSEKKPDTVTVSMDRALSSNNEIDTQYMRKSHILSWRCLGQSTRSNHKTWGQRQKPKTELFKELKLTTSKELACDDELNMEKLVVGRGATDDKSCHSVTDVSISSVKKCKRRKQLLQFDKSHRPPFYGAWPKKSHIIGPRHPLRQDPDLEYEIDSDEEWVEEDPGESLSDCDKDDEEKSEEGGLKAGDEEESDDDFFVPDGYLSENEGVEVDGMKIDCAVDEHVFLPGCEKDMECEEFNGLLRQQKYLYNVTDHALRKNQPLIISNLMHEKVRLVDAKDLASTPKLEQTCLQALSMRSFPGGIPVEILEDTVQSENEDAIQSFAKVSSTPTSAAIHNLDLPAFVSTIQSCSQGIDKVVKSLHNKFPGTPKSQLRNKVREISDFVDNRWQVKKDILDKLGMSNSPEKSGKRTKGIAAFFSKRCLPPAAAASMNPIETSPQKPPASQLIQLRLFDPKSSSTSKLVTCNQDFCTATYNGPIPGCKSDMLCQYNVAYGDGSQTSGYFVSDTVHLEQVSGNQQTSLMNGTVIFGCGAKQSGELGASPEALDGILGFGQANSSMISQLAAVRKVKKMFAHCLDNIEGGGIFAIGQVVEPKVTTTPIIPNQAHYNVAMKDIEVDGEVLQIPSDVFDLGNSRGAIIDSGTTLAYLPDDIFNPLMAKIMAKQSGLKLQTVEESFSCFTFSGSVNDEFPTVKFHFDDSLTLTVYPNEYLFQIRDDMWCFGWQNSGITSKDGKDMTLLGDLVFSNKLVVYDLENQVIGWTNYNCSSSIKVKDDSGTVYSVGAHNLSSDGSMRSRMSISLPLLLILIAMLYNRLH